MEFPEITTQMKQNSTILMKNIFEIRDQREETIPNDSIGCPIKFNNSKHAIFCAVRRRVDEGHYTGCPTNYDHPHNF